MKRKFTFNFPLPRNGVSAVVIDKHDTGYTITYVDQYGRYIHLAEQAKTRQEAIDIADRMHRNA